MSGQRGGQKWPQMWSLGYWCEITQWLKTLCRKSIAISIVCGLVLSFKKNQCVPIGSWVALSCIMKFCGISIHRF
jgi:hypothetical protein